MTRKGSRVFNGCEGFLEKGNTCRKVEGEAKRRGAESSSLKRFLN